MNQVYIKQNPHDDSLSQVFRLMNKDQQSTFSCYTTEFPDFDYMTLVQAKLSNIYQITGALYIDQDIFTLQYYPLSFQELVEQLNNAVSQLGTGMAALGTWSGTTNLIFTSQKIQSQYVITATGNMSQITGIKSGIIPVQTNNTNISDHVKFSDNGFINVNSARIITSGDKFECKGTLIVTILVAGLAQDPYYVKFGTKELTLLESNMVQSVHAFTYSLDNCYGEQYISTQVPNYNNVNFTWTFISVEDSFGIGQHNQTNGNNVFNTGTQSFISTTKYEMGLDFISIYTPLGSNTISTIKTALDNVHITYGDYWISKSSLTGSVIQFRYSFVRPAQYAMNFLTVLPISTFTYTFEQPITLGVKYLQIKCSNVNGQSDYIAPFDKSVIAVVSKSDKMNYFDKNLAVQMRIQPGQSDILEFRIEDQDNNLVNYCDCYLEFILYNEAYFEIDDQDDIIQEQYLQDYELVNSLGHK